MIRGLLLALERMDYDGAAYYFARGAIIDQGEPYPLEGPVGGAGLQLFSLPCRADLAGVRDEGRTVLASFRLRRGTRGPLQRHGPGPLHDPEGEVRRVASAAGAAAVRGRPGLTPPAYALRPASICSRSARRLSRRSCASRPGASRRRYGLDQRDLRGLPSSSRATIVRYAVQGA